MFTIVVLKMCFIFAIRNYKMQLKNNLKMKLNDFYNSLTEEAKTEFRNNVLKKTGRNIVTFYRWVNDTNRPSFNDQKLIARLANGKVKELFPNK